MRLIDRSSPPRAGSRSARLDAIRSRRQIASRARRTVTQRAGECSDHYAGGLDSGRPRRWSHVALIVELAVLALLASASSAHADTVVVAIADSVTDVLNNIRNWIMGILAGLATVFLSIGGVRYVMGGGDPGEVEKAKTAFKSAGWGYGLAALAPLVVEILKGIVGA